MMRFVFFGLLSLAFLLSAPALAQEDFAHPELDWRTIETEHFLVHYHTGTERTARTVAKVAEDIYGPITSLYHHTPDRKVSFIIRDHDDISNGGAYFFDNKIELYASGMDYELRGTHEWLRTVVSHEFTHIIQVQTSMKMGRAVPAIYLQWLNYEDERRPDVLYGYPNVIISYPLSGFIVPVWFAEGVAQYNRTEFRYDSWDSHRDMILRSYALDSNMLSWEEMGVFGKTSLGNESAYNAGFAFVAYIAQTYGEEKLLEISRNLASLTVISIDEAIRRAVGKPGSKVYDEWRAGVMRDYAERTQEVVRSQHRGEPLQVDSSSSVIDPEHLIKIESMFAPREQPVGPDAHWHQCEAFRATVGFANLHPVYSPDGTKAAYTSTKGGDYFGLSALYVYDFKMHVETLLQGGVGSAPAWSPDGKRLYYAKITRDNPHWSLYYDLYSYDLEKKEESRVTTTKRAVSPSLSPDGSRLVCIVNADGTTNLVTMRVDGSDVRPLTTFSEGEQVFNPRWSPDGASIVFDYSTKDGRDVARIKVDGTGFEVLVPGPDDARCASFTPDGTHLLFSSDRSGIFNIYRMDLATRQIEQLTNVVGGAFYPTINKEGKMLYSLYTSHGYKIYQMSAAVLGDTIGSYKMSPGWLPYPHTPITPAPPSFDWEALRSYDDTHVTEPTSRPYRGTFNSLTVVPLLRIDNYNKRWKGIELLKPGVFLFSNDVLDRTGIFAGAAINAKGERDLFLNFDYRGKIPLLYQIGLEPTASLELYNVTRKGEDAILALGLDTTSASIGYNLLEFDFALKQPAFSQFADLELRYMHSRYSSSVGDFVVPATQQLASASSELYLIANTLALTAKVNAILPSRTSEINPIGRKLMLRMSYEFNKFAATDSSGYREYEVTSTGVQPRYLHFSFPRVELSWQEYLPALFRHHTVMLSARAGSIFGPSVDEFFDFYAGGLAGMKGYPFYAIGGNTMASFGVAYRFPLVSDIGFRFAQIYFDKLYASVYADAGDAWTGVKPTLRGMKTDVGMQLRLQSFSFYAFPTMIFVDAAYGLNRFDRYIRFANTTVTYGREWRFYLGVLFGFDLD
jgi:hypothetical protein